MDAVTDAFNAILQSWQPAAAWPYFGGNQPFAPRLNVPGGCTTIVGVPATFTINSNSQVVTFTIPAGAYASATWESTGAWSGAGTNAVLTASTVNIITHGVTLAGPRSSNGTFTDSVAATASQLADINAAAGSDLTAILAITFKQDDVSVFTLTVCTAAVDNPPFGWRPWVHPIIRTWEAPPASWQAYYARPALAVGIPAPVDNPPFGLQGVNCGLRIAVLGNGPIPPLPARPFWVVQPGVPPPVDNPPLGWMRVNIAASIRAWDAAPPLPWHPNWLSEPKAVDPGYDIWEVYSDDNGLTWGVAVMAIPNGKYPTIAVGNDGTVVRAAWVASLIKCTVQRPGDVNQSGIITFKDNAGADLLYSDERFHIQQGREGPDRWLLHCTAAGDTGTSDWYSSDLGAGITSATWTRIT